jgi:putative phosphoribosyl transferase
MLIARMCWCWHSLVGVCQLGMKWQRHFRPPLDVFVVRKLGVPRREELAMGALATGGIGVINEEVVQMLHLPQEVIAAVVAKEQRELERRERLYRDDRPPPDVNGCIVILVDDGLATGSTMLAAAASRASGRCSAGSGSFDLRGI